MTTLLEIREYMKSIYSRYSQVMTMAAKFFITLIAVILIGNRIGYNETVSGALVAVVVSLLSSLIPWGGICAILGLVILLNLWAVSMEVAAVGAVIFLLIFLLYFRFSPGDGVLLVLTPICCACGIPYVMPLAAGLLCTPAAAVPVSFGYLLYYFIHFVSANSASLTGGSGEEALNSVTFLADGVFRNPTMIVMIVAGIAAVILVYYVRRLRIANAWLIASGAGALVELVILIIGGIRYDTEINIGFAILGEFLSLAICLVLTFLFFNLDYSRTESLQFEDDDYYYYVKAVPKVSLQTRERTVKKINQTRRVREDDYPEDSYGDGYQSGEEYPDTGSSYDPPLYEERGGADSGYADEGADGFSGDDRSGYRY